MSLANPSELACFAEDGKTINVIVETPKGSRNKFAFDEKRKIFRLKKFYLWEWHFLMTSGLYLPRRPRTAIQWMF
jgi:inorganic pyrophosphatase